MTYLDGKDDVVGKRVRIERTKKGLTITQLAEITGISVVTICRLEKGIIHARLCNLQKIADALQINLEKIIK